MLLVGGSGRDGFCFWGCLVRVVEFLARVCV